MRATRSSPAEDLGRLPRHGSAERLRPVHEWLHCLGRSLTYFDPNERRLALEIRIDLIIRQGYLGRNPLTTSFHQRLGPAGPYQQNGHWNRTVLDGRGAALTCAWTPRVLRKKGARSDDDYVKK